MTSEQIQKLYSEFHTPLHVQRHCKAVAEFGALLARKLQEQGINVNEGLVYDAGLLHDLVRYVDFRVLNPEEWNYDVEQADVAFWKSMRVQYAGVHHADVGADILESKGFHDLAEIVRKHNFLQILKGFNTWEEKLVYYADKRAKHDEIVPLLERLMDGRKRNQPHLMSDPLSSELDTKVAVLEAEIFAAIGMSPEALDALSEL